MNTPITTSPKCRKMGPYLYSYNEEDGNRAQTEWGCNCGPGALAAMLGLKPDQVRHFIPNFEERRYTNPTMMQSALRSLGVTFTELDDSEDREHPEAPQRLPLYGLCRVQWEGPWLKPGVPPAAAYKYTHWIGSAIDSKTGYFHIFDVNFGWNPVRIWSTSGVKEMTSWHKRATGGFSLTHRWELSFS